jgi:hypothetical protein
LSVCRRSAAAHRNDGSHALCEGTRIDTVITAGLHHRAAVMPPGSCAGGSSPRRRATLMRLGMPSAGGGRGGSGFSTATPVVSLPTPLPRMPAVRSFALRLFFDLWLLAPAPKSAAPPPPLAEPHPSGRWCIKSSSPDTKLIISGGSCPRRGPPVATKCCASLTALWNAWQQRLCQRAHVQQCKVRPHPGHSDSAHLGFVLGGIHIEVSLKRRDLGAITSTRERHNVSLASRARRFQHVAVALAFFSDSTHWISYVPKKCTSTQLGRGCGGAWWPTCGDSTCAGHAG